MQGAFLRACSNISRTRLAPTPTNISTKSEPEILKNGTLASPAIALANNVLPVPGGPTIKTPFGIFAPKRSNFWGSRRNSTISSTSCLASSTPATSSNVTRVVSWFNNFALLLPKPMAPPRPPPPIWRNMKNQNPISNAMGKRLLRIAIKPLPCSSTSFAISTPDASIASSKPTTFNTLVSYNALLPSKPVATLMSRLPLITTVSNSPRAARSLNSVTLMSAGPAPLLAWRMKLNNKNAASKIPAQMIRLREFDMTIRLFEISMASTKRDSPFVINPM